MKKFYRRLLILLFVVGISIFLDRKYLIPNGIFYNQPALSTSIQVYGKSSPIQVGKGKLLIPSKTGIELLDSKEFVMASTVSGEKGFKLISATNEKIRVGQSSLSELENALSKLTVPIFRLNSYILNMDFVSRIEREDVSQNYNSPNYKYTIILETGTSIPLPKEKYKIFMQDLKRHFQIADELEIDP